MPKQILSWHPDMDRHLPWVTLYGILGITTVMSVYELSSSIIWPYIQSFVPKIEIKPDVAAKAATYQLVEYATTLRDHAHTQHPALSADYKVYDEPVPYSKWPRDLDGTLIALPTYKWQHFPIAEGKPSMQYPMPILTQNSTPLPIHTFRYYLPVLLPPGIELMKDEKGRKFFRAPRPGGPIEGDDDLPPNLPPPPGYSSGDSDSDSDDGKDEGNDKGSGDNNNDNEKQTDQEMTPGDEASSGNAPHDTE